MFLIVKEPSEIIDHKLGLLGELGRPRFESYIQSLLYLQHTLILFKPYSIEQIILIVKVLGEGLGEFLYNFPSCFKQVA